MQEMLARLAHTNEIMTHTDQAIAGMEAKVGSHAARFSACTSKLPWVLWVQRQPESCYRL